MYVPYVVVEEVSSSVWEMTSSLGEMTSSLGRMTTSLGEMTSTSSREVPASVWGAERKTVKVYNETYLTCITLWADITTTRIELT